MWRAWTDAASLERWWIPAPTRCRVDRLEPRPGGALVTSTSDDGAPFAPHLDACLLVVDELDRTVFTNAIDSELRPATGSPVPMTAEVTPADHPTAPALWVLVSGAFCLRPCSQRLSRKSRPAADDKAAPPIHHVCMHEFARKARERIIATEVLKLERRQALARSHRPPHADTSPPKKVAP